MYKTKSIVIGTRGSALALWQSNHVASLLTKGGIESTLEKIVTTGDIRLDKPLPELGDKGLFTAELDAALLDGRVDLAVHSLKDLPTEFPDELSLVAVSDRAAPWDVMVALDPAVSKPEDLPRGATIGTSSLRRSAQLLAWRPDLTIVSVRGNVETRIRKVETEHMDGVVLAEAGITRLGLGKHISFRFDDTIMLPAVAQGALGIVAASSRTDIAEIAGSLLNHAVTAEDVTAERAFLRRLEGGCQVPVAAYATHLEDGSIHLVGCVASLDGTRVLRDEIEGDASDPDRLGVSLAESLLSRGADGILSAIRESGESGFTTNS